MTDEELSKLQQEMYDQAINMPEELEQKIIDVAEQVSNYLFIHSNKGMKIEFNDDILRFAPIVKTYVGFKCILITKVDVLNESYEKGFKRFRIDSEYENELSLLENYRAIIACFLRNRYVCPQVGEIEEGSD